MRLYWIVFPFIVLLTGCSLFSSNSGRHVFSSFRSDEYVTRPGDTYRHIQESFGVPRGVLQVVNDLDSFELLPGTKLRIPFFEELYPRFRRREGEMLGFMPTQSRGPPLLWPVLGGKISSYFGKRAGKQHCGLDIRGPKSTPVFASFPGEVTFAGNSHTDYGKIVRIHRGSLSFLYAHLNEVLVEEGTFIEQGDLIGLLGTTGNATGPHVHFEVRSLNSKLPLDPLKFFQGP